MKKVTYAQVGDNYATKDPIKKIAQIAARQTGKNLKDLGFSEISQTRGESAFVWQQGKVLMASVIESLGTKTLVADAMRPVTDKTYYDVAGHDTVATIINDLITVGARPLVVHAFWAIEDNSWFADRERMEDLINGWKNACDLAGAIWGGGETPTLKGIIEKGKCDLGGSAVGIVGDKKRLITDDKLRQGDRILFLKSSGINDNGISLARAIAKKLKKGYATKLASGRLYGEAVLNKTNIYAKLVANLLDGGVDIHYISNITGHGLRKVMRARGSFTYVVEKLFQQQEVFEFIKKEAGIDDFEMYQTYNMGQDYAIIMPSQFIKKAQSIAVKNGFESIDAGYLEKGERKVIIKPKNITYTSETLDLR